MSETTLPPATEAPTKAEIYERLDRATVTARREERERLRVILECDRWDLWQGNGARSHAEFLAGRLNISQFKARRLIGAAYALEFLPRISHALESGVISLDTAVELSRFATPATEEKLLKWARRVTPRSVMERANEETRRSKKVFEDAYQARSLDWWHSLDGTELHIEGRVPTDVGEKFVKAIDRLLPDATPSVPEGDPDFPAAPTLEQRRADALGLLCSAQIADDQDPDRATMVLHAPAQMVIEDDPGFNALFESGGVADARTVQKLACEGRIEVACYNKDGEVFNMGRTSRFPSRRLRRMVLKRHRNTCAFPACNMKRFLNIHHIQWWEWLGPTDYDNLIPLCHFHHDLIHDHGWNVMLQVDEAIWFRPDGRRFEPGPKESSDSPAQPSTSSSDAPPTDAAWPALMHMLHSKDHELTRDASTRALLKVGLKQLL
jgi:hypothetical protein